MTDRFSALTVALSDDIREDDAEHIIAAIKMMRGVSDVKGEVADIGVFVAKSRLRREFVEKIMVAIREAQKDD